MSVSPSSDTGLPGSAVPAATRLLSGRRVVALTGAGLSTDSGIPDYRGPDSAPRHPMTIAQFRSGPQARQRYWARAHVGHLQMIRAQPNGGHRALARCDARALSGDSNDAGVGTGPGISTLITQNVDGLHQAAGSARVVDLHGRLSVVRCLDCGQRSTRTELHDRLSALNPDVVAEQVAIAPDGDAEVDDTAGFVVAPCRRCGGVLKPDVVFFGESVARVVVQRCFAAVDAADALLVAGSSLTVWSGFRFVRHAARRGLPVVIVNRGPTRADDLATLRIDGGCTPVLTALADTLPVG